MSWRLLRIRSERFFIKIEKSRKVPQGNIVYRKEF